MSKFLMSQAFIRLYFPRGNKINNLCMRKTKKQGKRLDQIRFINTWEYMHEKNNNNILHHIK